MKNSCLIASFCFISFFLLAEEPAYIQEIYHNFSQTDMRWDKFQKELDWFFDLAQEDWSSVEEDKIRKALKEKQEMKRDQLKDSVLQVLNQFLVFREQTARVLESQFHGGSYSNTVYADALYELTEWYVTFMEKQLFPHNWKELYKKNVEEKDLADRSLSSDVCLELNLGMESISSCAKNRRVVHDKE